MADFQRVHEDEHMHWRFLLPHELPNNTVNTSGDGNQGMEDDNDGDDDGYWDEYPDLKSQEEIESEEREQRALEQKIQDCTQLKGRLMELFSIAQGQRISGAEFAQLASEVVAEMDPDHPRHSLLMRSSSDLSSSSLDA